jgi:hypothetical protein
MSGKVALKGAIFVVFTGLVMGVFLFLFDVHLFNKTESLKKSSNNFNVKSVQYSFQIWNTKNQPVANVHFYVHAPLKQTSTQRCIGIESSYPYEVVTDILGNQVLKYTFEIFPPLASKSVSIRANLILATSPVTSAKTEFVKGVNSTTEAVYIRQLADRLKLKTVRATALNIHRWVADNITYTGYLKRAKGAPQTLMNRTGDCTEFADLFVALAHAADIQARRVSGYISHENRILKPTDFHDWAEFYENGVWRIADPQQRNFDANYPNYIAMKIYIYTAKNRSMNGENHAGGFHRFYVDGNGLTAKMDT